MTSVHRCAATISWTLIPVFFSLSFAQSNLPKTAGWTGKIADVRSWSLPNTPNGLMPDQNWHCVGNDPYGGIYVGGMDHQTNSALYRVPQGSDTLYYIGDAKQASTDANNWKSGESCQKFHSRPTYHDGRVYVASADRTDIGSAYLQSRGFHWYAYDIAQSKFIDVSAAEPNGVGAANLQEPTITVDPIKNLLYGMSNAVCTIVKHDIAKNTTVSLGKPAAWKTQYMYINRFMWVDSRSKLYFSAGNERSQWYSGEDKTVYDNIFSYDPGTNLMAEVPGFSLKGANSTEIGMWNREHTKLYCCDDFGHLYCFDDSAQTWTYLGMPDFAGTIKVWSLQVAPNGKKLYVARCDNAHGYSEFDLQTKTCKPFFTVKELDDKSASFDFLTGYDTWDRDGNFFFAMHTMFDDQPVVLTRVNPVKVKVAKGLLPELVFVSATAADLTAILISRSGSTATTLEALYDISGYDTNGKLLKRAYGRTTIPAGQASCTLQKSQLPYPTGTGIVKTVFEIVSDGCDYLAGSARSIQSPVIKRLPESGTDAAAMHPLRIGKSGRETTIELYLENAAQARLSLFDMRGRCIAVPVDAYLTAGIHRVSLTKRAGKGTLAESRYIARCTLGNSSYSRSFRM
jgi:hypothetical protein